MNKPSKFMLTLLAAVVLLAGCTKKSSEKQILSFSFHSPEVEATITESAKTIVATMPSGTDVTALVPIVTVSEKASVNPASGIPQDFTHPVTYTVTAEDGSQASYIVTVTVENGGGNGGGDGHEYVDLGLPSGLLWATCNVGADKPEKYGDYFAWGETAPKSIYDWYTYQHTDYANTLTKYTESDGLTILLPEDDAAAVNWGNGWRMPTAKDYEELLDNTSVGWVLQNGVGGRIFIASNGNSLFMPAAGYRDGTSLKDAGTDSYIWSSSLYVDHMSNAKYLYFNSSYCYTYDKFRYCGLTVRPVRSAE